MNGILVSLLSRIQLYTRVRLSRHLISSTARNNHLSASLLEDYHHFLLWQRTCRRIRRWGGHLYGEAARVGPLRAEAKTQQQRNNCAHSSVQYFIFCKGCHLASACVQSRELYSTLCYLLLLLLFPLFSFPSPPLGSLGRPLLSLLLPSQLSAHLLLLARRQQSPSCSVSLR